MSQEEQIERVKKYVELISANGIFQHSQEWEKVKLFTIGGSSLAAIQGKSHFGDKFSLIRERVGLMANRNFDNINCQWGNLFEETIKVYFEKRFDCTVFGEDIYISGGESRPGCSYSPDGLTVIKRGDIPNAQPQIVLCEFKCPHSRMPTSKPPPYYVPQVKMGLDIIDLAQIGVLCEGVFRRCGLAVLGYGAGHDTTLVPKEVKFPVIACGITGFYMMVEGDEGDDGDNSAKTPRTPQYVRKMTAKFADEFKNDVIPDLGTCSPELMKLMMSAYDNGHLRPWYGNIMRNGVDVADADTIANEVARFREFCRENNHQFYGVLPWKLFQFNVHWIERTPDYLLPWLDEIAAVTNCVKECFEENADRNDIYARFTDREFDDM